MYKPNGNKELEEYLKLPAKDDSEVEMKGNKIMRDYLTEANNVNIENINDYLKNGRVVALDTFLRARGIDTLIITGSATHVCEDAAVSAASEQGFHIIEPIDAVASQEFDKHCIYLHNHGLFKTQLATTKKILERLKENQNANSK